MQDTRWCPFCGEPRHSGGRFCPKCGNRYPFDDNDDDTAVADAEPTTVLPDAQSSSARGPVSGRPRPAPADFEPPPFDAPRSESPRSEPVAPLPPPRPRSRGRAWSHTIPFVLAVILGVVGLGYALSRYGASYLEGSRPTPETVLAPVGASPVAPAGSTAAASPSPGTVLIAPPNTAAGERVRVVNTDGQGANLRQDANTTAAVIATVPDDTVLEIIGPDRPADGRVWRNVREPGGATGWIASDFLAPT